MPKKLDKVKRYEKQKKKIQENSRPSSGPKSKREDKPEEISKEVIQEISSEVKHMTFRLKRPLSFWTKNEGRPIPRQKKSGVRSA